MVGYWWYLFMWWIGQCNRKVGRIGTPESSWFLRESYYRSILSPLIGNDPVSGLIMDWMCSFVDPPRTRVLICNQRNFVIQVNRPTQRLGGKLLINSWTQLIPRRLTILNHSSLCHVLVVIIIQPLSALSTVTIDLPFLAQPRWYWHSDFPVWSIIS